MLEGERRAAIQNPCQGEVEAAVRAALGRQKEKVLRVLDGELVKAAEVVADLDINSYSVEDGETVDALSRLRITRELRKTIVALGFQV